MPETWHPALEAEIAAEGTTPAPPEPTPQPEPEKAAETPDASAPSTPADEGKGPDNWPRPPSEEDLVIKLSRSNLYQEIAKAYDGDPDFKKRVSEFMGRRSKREYEVRVRELEADRDRLLREQRIAEISQMGDAELDQRYRADPEFAREYTELVHGEAPNPDETAEVAYFEVTRDEEFERAARVIAPERLADFDAAFGFCPVHRTNDHGFYDHDEAGNFYVAQYGEKTGRMAAFDRFRRLLGAEVTKVSDAARTMQGRPPAPSAARSPSSPAPAAAAPPAAFAAPEEGAGNPNPRLVGAGPDVSSASRPSNGRAKYTRDEVRAMSWEQRINLWPEPGSYERDVEAGLVSIPGVNAPER